MATNLEGKPMDTYLFVVFHTSLDSILCTELENKNDLSVESVPSSAVQDGVWQNDIVLHIMHFH
jgi:hypothetical protein